jgi:hypothetical protein
MKKNYYNIENAYIKEKFFMTYALNGALIDKENGIRSGQPDLRPIKGPVKEPSPLNTKWIFDFDKSSEGIL